MQNNLWKISTFVLIGVLILFLAYLSFNSQGALKWQKNQLSIDEAQVETASAQEIYPLFACPCCGQSIARECCGMAKERKAFLDGVVAGGSLTEKEVILTYVKKYGLNSFTKEGKEKQTEIRAVLAAEAPAERPIISLNPVSYDFGEVSQKQGVVTTLFELKNEGKSDLVIDKLETSCGCTSASIVFQGKEGPRFYMAGHGKENPTDWQIAIPPGQTAQLKVYYDPNVHQDFRGPAVRTISVFSNDPIDFEKKVTIELNQID